MLQGIKHHRRAVNSASLETAAFWLKLDLKASVGNVQQPVLQVPTWALNKRNVHFVYWPCRTAGVTYECKTSDHTAELLEHQMNGIQGLCLEVIGHVLVCSPSSEAC